MATSVAMALQSQMGRISLVPMLQRDGICAKAVSQCRCQHQFLRPAPTPARHQHQFLRRQQTFRSVATQIAVLAMIHQIIIAIRVEKTFVKARHLQVVRDRGYSALQL